MNKEINQSICVITLGCSKNIVDSEILIGGINSANVSIVKDPIKADTIIVNTCGFLESAREESVDVILEAGELKKTGNLKKLIVAGCFSERYKDELHKELPEVDYFFGSNDHSDIIAMATGEKYKQADPEYFRSLLTPNHYAYLKIAEGCDNGCSFCSIPLMRGLQVSKPVEENVLEAQRLADSGVKELLVIAQDSTSYGWDLPKKSSLHELMDKLDNITGLEWIRLHYAHPAHLHREMMNRFNSLKKLLPYIDMPVQHGSDSILKSMRRGLKSDGIRKKIQELREINSNIVIRTSIIVGYPGETEKDFQKLYDFVDEIKFDRLGVFTYSHEEDTHGYNTLKDNIPQQVKFDRMDAIMLLQQDINLEKNKRLIGSTEKVLIDLYTDDGFSIGRSYRDSPEVDNTVRIKDKLPIGEILDIKITDATEYELIGSSISPQ